MSSISRKIAYNAIVSASAKVLSTILALVGIGFITRYLGKEGFGDYAVVLAFFAFFGALADLGLYSISTREISRPGSDEKGILGNVFAIRLTTSLAVVVLTPIIVAFFPYSSLVKQGIFLAALAYIFSSGYAVLIGLFQKRLAMDKVAIGELIGRIFQVAAIVIAVKLNLGFIAVIGTLLLNMLISFSIIYFWSRRYVKFGLRFERAAWGKFLKESYPVGISAIIIFAYFKLDTILLSVMKASSDVGIYNVAYKVVENISFFPAMLIGLIMPLMSRYIFHDRTKFDSVANKTFKVFLILTVPLVIGTLFLAKDIISLIGGTGFLESVAVLKLLALAMAFVFFGHFFTNIIIAGNLQRKLMKVLFFCAIFNIAANLFLIPRFSYFGAAITSSLTEFLVVILSGFLAYKHLNYFPSFEKAFAIFTAGAAMAGVLYVFGNLNFFALAVVSGSVYFLLLWISRAVSTEEILSLISKKGEEVREHEMVT